VSNFPAGLSGFTTYPGSLISTGAVSNSSAQSYCSCGAVATRIFFNPKGISYNLSEVTPCLTLCSGCDFRYTVARAAGRSEEFIVEYEEKQRVRTEEEAERQRAMFHQYQQAQQQAQYVVYGQDVQNAGQTSMETERAAQGLRTVQQADDCGENVAYDEKSGKFLPVKPWWKRW